MKFAVFNNLTDDRFAEKLTFFPIQKVDLSPEVVYQAGWEYVKATMKKAEEYGVEVLPLLIPAVDIGDLEYMEYLGVITPYIKSCKYIDLGIETCIAQYRKEEYFKYYGLATISKVSENKKIIAPGYYLTKESDFRDLEYFYNKLKFSGLAHMPDIVGVHLYDSLKNKKKMLDRVFNLTDKPIAITETGFDSKPRLCCGKECSERRQLKGYEEWIGYLQSLPPEKKDQIVLVAIYTCINDPRYSHSKEGHFGLLRADLSEKPAYHYFKELIDG